MNDQTARIQKLSIVFQDTTVVNEISFQIPQGKTVAIVGESGSGKSVTALAMMGLLPLYAKVSGEIWFNHSQLLNLAPSVRRRINGGEIAMIFQEPMSSLNPVFTIGEQVEEAVRIHHRVSRRASIAKAITALEEVGISKQRFRGYPHEFSGGMRQRVMIAMALVCEPTLLIADEPTTALDATTSKQIVEVLDIARQQRGMSMLFITHDLSLVSSIADRICVMRRGAIVESGSASEVMETPTHPYTRALLACRPSLERRQQRLLEISEDI